MQTSGDDRNTIELMARILQDVRRTSAVFPLCLEYHNLEPFGWRCRIYVRVLSKAMHVRVLIYDLSWQMTLKIQDSLVDTTLSCSKNRGLNLREKSLWKLVLDE